MLNAVTTPNQLSERVKELAADAGMTVSLTARLIVDGTRVYANVSCHCEEEATDLVHVIRAHREGFGPQGEKMTIRRDYRHVIIFLPIEADAERGAQFLSAITRPTTEF